MTRRPSTRDAPSWTPWAPWWTAGRSRGAASRSRWSTNCCARCTSSPEPRPWPWPSVWGWTPPRCSTPWHFDEAYRAGEIELELVPQGNLAERLRAGGAGIGGFFTPTGYGTQLAEGKEVREIDGTHYVLEAPIRGDVALIKAYAADRHGNLVYRKTARNFGPVMAAAAATTIVQVDEVREEPIDPEHVVTPGIYTDTVVRIDTESGEKERAERAALAEGRPKPCAATTTAAEPAAEGK